MCRRATALQKRTMAGGMKVGRVFTEGNEENEKGVEGAVMSEGAATGLIGSIRQICLICLMNDGC